MASSIAAPISAESLTVDEAVAWGLGRRDGVRPGDWLRVGHRMVADLGPDDELCLWSVATSKCTPITEHLAAMISQGGQGVLVLDDIDDPDPIAFWVQEGRVRGARGAQSVDQLEQWMSTLCAAGGRFDGGDDQAQWAAARTFVEERLLDRLARFRARTGRMVWLSGGIRWIDASVPGQASGSLTHLLMEFARRSDEGPKLLAALGDLAAVPVAQTPPPVTPQKPPRKTGGDDSWDFFDDPDPAALSEWADARWMYGQCDGETTIAEIVDRAMLGTFRAVAGLSILLERHYVALYEDERDAQERMANASTQELPAQTRDDPPGQEPAANDDPDWDLQDDDDPENLVELHPARPSATEYAYIRRG